MDEVVWLDEIPDSERWMIPRTSTRRFRVGDTDYLIGFSSSMPCLCIKKAPGLVAMTVDFLRDFRNANIVELGISRGGSTALIAQIAEPRKLVALELDPDPVEPLEQFIDEAGCRATVRPHYGIDQADRAVVSQIIDDEFGAESLDLVTDDASHLLDLTRTSFEILFPRLRPGGVYIIEDWNWEHVRAKAVVEATSEDSPDHELFRAHVKERLADRSSPEYAAFTTWFSARAKDPDHAPAPRPQVRPLSILVLQLLMARAWSGDAVSELTIKDGWVIAVRGPAQLDPDTFRVDDIVHDRFDLLP